MRAHRGRRIFPGRSEPAEMPPPGQHEIEHEELSRLFGRMVGARLVAIPVFVAGAAWLVSAEPALWRRIVLGAAGLLVPAFFLVEWLRFRRSGFTARAVPINLTIACLAQSVVTFASGGAHTGDLRPDSGKAAGQQDLIVGADVRAPVDVELVRRHEAIHLPSR